MKRYHGEGTYYNAGISEGACGGWHKSSELVAAVSRQQWHGGEFCNQMLHVCHHGKCTDVQVVDECPSCDYGSLDLSPTAFKQLAPMSEGVIDINWTFA
ncbi:hypothetical protein K437DRAFT_222057 [Tilletiaria anomala UBC 951]|uniref:RlpA-like protein double-psi beta-barrel domain-containing protein n=1 Tax=Tilletiaria anomala (strain ATCC 24038 / CBS 436.72 / UBC 951) TaxID=1037660 RepID=A0A066W885_TILAU|nr:uncharacterized protein K437DRAFT_222057 [Tilletiaria anomala UBC 951]KDN49931.1 hypothetical protein K437DRAFT_222057 [Tilletiaria anomala UBC 951]